MKKFLYGCVALFAIVTVAHASQMDWKFTASSSESAVSGDSVYLVFSSYWPSSITSAADISTAAAQTGYSNYSATIGPSGAVLLANDTIQGLPSTASTFYFVVVDTTTSSYWKSAVQDASTYLYTAGSSSP